jgi:hypothetical protein
MPKKGKLLRVFNIKYDQQQAHSSAFSRASSLIGRFKGADPTGFILCSQLFTAALLFF